MGSPHGITRVLADLDVGLIYHIDLEPGPVPVVVVHHLSHPLAVTDIDPERTVGPPGAVRLLAAPTNTPGKQNL